MNYQILIIGGICLIVGLLVGILLARKRSDFVSSLVGFIIFGKQQNKSSETIRLSVINLTDLLLKGYDNFEKDEKTANANLKRDQKDLKNKKALIKAMQKTINKANKLLEEWR